MLKRLPTAFVFCLALVAGAGSAAFSSSASAQANVVATIKPLQLIAAAITEGVSDPALLVPSNQSYHHFTLRPSSMRSLTGADLLIWVGPGLESYLADAINQLPPQQVLSVMSLSELTRHQFSSKVLLSADQNASLGLKHGLAQHSHSHGPIDPHVWLDTNNALLIAQAITLRLSELDGRHARQYQQNLQRFENTVLEMNARIAQSLAPYSETDYAVYHNAFQYFEKQQGLQHRLVFVEDDEMQPGVRQMLAVRNALQSVQLQCLLEDVTANPATIETMLGNISLRRVRADTLGDSLPADAQSYVQLIENLAAAFRQCLQD